MNSHIVLNHLKTLVHGLSSMKWASWSEIVNFGMNKKKEKEKRGGLSVVGQVRPPSDKSDRRRASPTAVGRSPTIIGQVRFLSSSNSGGYALMN